MFLEASVNLIASLTLRVDTNEDDDQETLSHSVVLFETWCTFLRVIPSVW